MSDVQEKLKSKVTEDAMLETMNQEFAWVFLHPSDLQVAYMIGLYFQLANYWQITILNTKGLQKKIRALFDKMNREKLLKVFDESNKVFLAIQNKRRSQSMMFWKVRSQTETLLGNAEWASSSTELSIAFMFGYDSFHRTYTRLRE